MLRSNLFTLCRLCIYHIIRKYYKNSHYYAGDTPLNLSIKLRNQSIIQINFTHVFFKNLIIVLAPKDSLSKGKVNPDGIALASFLQKMHKNQSMYLLFPSCIIVNPHYSLQWLPVKYRIEFKILQAYKALKGEL